MVSTIFGKYSNETEAENTSKIYAESGPEEKELADKLKDLPMNKPVNYLWLIRQLVHDRLFLSESGREISVFTGNEIIFSDSDNNSKKTMISRKRLVIEAEK